jgi:hypothetical protein
MTFSSAKKCVMTSHLYDPAAADPEATNRIVGFHYSRVSGNPDSEYPDPPPNRADSSERNIDATTAMKIKAISLAITTRRSSPASIAFKSYRMADLGSGSATWNRTPEDVTVAIGERNKFTPPPFDRGQLSVFPAGVRHFAFSVVTDQPELTWHIDKTNVHVKIRDAPVCPPHDPDRPWETPPAEPNAVSGSN